MTSTLQIPARILIVEDDPEFQVYLRTTLASVGIDVRLAEDGNQALETLDHDSRIALIITDLAMPGMNGIEFLRRAVYTHPNLLALVVTGANDDDTGARAQAPVNVRGTLRKPVDGEVLISAVTALLGDHLYDQPVIDCLIEGTMAIIASARLDRVVTPGTPFLRRNSQLLGRMSSFLDIAGDHLVGKLIVSGVPMFFSRLVRGWLSQQATSRASLWDAMGEMSNQLAGKLRMHYSSRGYRSTMATPMVVAGERVQIKHATQMPSLVIPFSVEGIEQNFYVEWILAEKGPEEGAEEGAGKGAEEGAGIASKDG